MKRFLILTLLFSAVAFGALGVLFASPYYFYNKVIGENYRSRWFFLDQHRPELVTPGEKLTLEDPGLGNEDLWSEFHLRDTVIPLPVRNPFYYVAPLISYDEKRKATRLGLAVYGTGYREISKIYFVSNTLLGSEIRSQELFKLPLAKKIIKSSSPEKVWKDIFGKSIADWNIPFSEMVYNLYILQLRSKLFPENMTDFRPMDDTTGIATLESQNKDYVTELVMTRKRGIVYSYIIVTEKNNKESKVLRYKFLREISFRPGSEALAGILYKEFKALPYNRQIDHEGMLYLLSAWSHQTDNSSYLKEMVFYLERGEGNQKQLKPLYEYASKRYGEVFAEKLVEGVEMEAEMRLQRDIELERKAELRRLKNRKVGANEAAPTEEEKVKNRIRKAKSRKRGKADRMILD